MTTESGKQPTASQSNQPLTSTAEKISAVSTILKGEKAPGTKPDEKPKDDSAVLDSVKETYTEQDQDRDDPPATPEPQKASDPEKHSDDSTSETGSSDADADDVPVLTLNDFAEQTQTDIKDIYQLSVKLQGEKEPVTLGEIKDSYQNQQQLTERENTLESDRESYEKRVIKANQEIQAIMQLIGPQVTPQLRQQAQKLVQNSIEREVQLMLDVIPAWKDQTVRADEFKGMIKHLENYGLSKSDFQAITDHRILKFIRDSWQREQKLTAAQDFKPEKKPPKTLGKKRNAKPPEAKPKSPEGRAGKISAVSELLRKG